MFIYLDVNYSMTLNHAARTVPYIPLQLQLGTHDWSPGSPLSALGLSLVWEKHTGTYHRKNTGSKCTYSTDCPNCFIISRYFKIIILCHPENVEFRIHYLEVWRIFFLMSMLRVLHIWLWAAVSQVSLYHESRRFWINRDKLTLRELADGTIDRASNTRSTRGEGGE